MNAEQLTHLESDFGIRFSGEYREALVAYPFARDFEEFTANAAVLREENSRCRTEPHWGFSWEPCLWWIGDDGCGGFYFINCDDDVCRVYYLDHEDPAETIADQARLKPVLLSQFLGDLRRFDAEFEEDRRRLLERIASRRWWQFWIPKSAPAWAQDKRNSKAR